MNSEQILQQYLITADERLLKLRELASVMKEFTVALVELDVNALERNTMHLSELCNEVQCLSGNLAELNVKLANAAFETHEKVAGVFPQRRQAEHQQLTAVLSEMRQRARMHSALLRRSARTVQILTNVLATRCLTYCVEPQPRPLTDIACREKRR